MRWYPGLRWSLLGSSRLGPFNAVAKFSFLLSEYTPRPPILFSNPCRPSAHTLRAESLIDAWAVMLIAVGCREGIELASLSVLLPSARVLFREAEADFVSLSLSLLLFVVLLSSVSFPYDAPAALYDTDLL